MDGGAPAKRRRPDDGAAHDVDDDGGGGGHHSGGSGMRGGFHDGAPYDDDHHHQRPYDEHDRRPSEYNANAGAPPPARPQHHGRSVSTASASSTGSAGSNVTAPSPTQANGLSPNDWQFAFSRSRKRWYYFKPATGQSVFESPGELEACTPQLCDLAAPTNVVISHGPARPRLTPTEHLLWLKQATPHPHPYHEVLRAEALARLRNYYDRICQERFRWPLPPRESFNHWVWRMQAQAAVLSRDGKSLLSDPVLAVPLTEEDGHAGPIVHRTKTTALDSVTGTPLKRQLIESLPTNTKPHKYLKSPFQVCKSLRGHADQAVFLSETYGSGPTYDEDLATIRRAADDARRWLRDMREPTLEEAMVRVDQFRAVALPPLKRLLEVEITDICNVMNAAASMEARQLAEQTRRSETASAVFDPPLAFNDLSIRLDGQLVCIRYRDQELPLQHRHWDKLRALYERQHADQELLLPRLWCMLRRYQTVFGGQGAAETAPAARATEGSGFHAAAPVSLFKALQETLAVGLECFASPLNCYLPTYCSAFADTDRFFGSLGSFFHLDLQEGSYQANPPFNEEVMAAMADRIEELLSASTAGALSFAVIVPEWVNPPTPALETMKRSRFLRAELVVKSTDHAYRNGQQHLVQESVELFPPFHDSHLFILQNDAGADRWPATPGVMERLAAAWSVAPAPRSVSDGRPGPSTANGGVGRRQSSAMLDDVHS